MFNRKHALMTQSLPVWAADLLKALEIDPVDVDTAALRRIADGIDHDQHTDDLLVGFIAGYAAGMAQGSGMADFDKAHAASVRFMTKNVAAE